MDYARNLLAKPAISAATGYAILPIALPGVSKFIVDDNKSISIGQLGAVLGAVSSFGTEFISNIILPHISKNEKIRHAESLVLHLGSSGAMFAIIPNIFAPLDMNARRGLFLAGVASEVISNFVYSNFIHSDNVAILG